MVLCVALMLVSFVGVRTVARDVGEEEGGREDGHRQEDSVEAKGEVSPRRSGLPPSCRSFFHSTPAILAIRCPDPSDFLCLPCCPL